MAKVRYGIIGSGMMGHEHMRNIALQTGAEVVGVADPDEGMRESAAKLGGKGTEAFADYRDLLSADLCDAFVGGSPELPPRHGHARPRCAGEAGALREAALHHGCGLQGDHAEGGSRWHAGMGRNGIPLHRLGRAVAR